MLILPVITMLFVYFIYPDDFQHKQTVYMRIIAKAWTAFAIALNVQYKTMNRTKER